MTKIAPEPPENLWLAFGQNDLFPDREKVGVSFISECRPRSHRCYVRGSANTTHGRSVDETFAAGSNLFSQDKHSSSCYLLTKELYIKYAHAFQRPPFVVLLPSDAGWNPPAT